MRYLLVGLLFLFISCGKSAIDSGPKSLSTNPLLDSSGLIGGTSAASQMQVFRNTVACLGGTYRLASDVNFYNNDNPINETVITGNWQAGLMKTGTISGLYVGINDKGHLMFVTKVTDGFAGKVTGYNVTLSLCGVPDIYPNPSLISNYRSLVDFQAPNGIILGPRGSCNYRPAIADNAIVISQKNSTDANTSDYALNMTFRNPTCN